MRREMAAGSERKLPQDLGESADGHDAEKNRSERPRTEAVPGAKPSGDRPLVATGPHLPSLSFAPCARHLLRQESSAGNPLAGICAGGTEQSVSLPRHPPPPDAEGSAILTLEVTAQYPAKLPPGTPVTHPAASASGSDRSCRSATRRSHPPQGLPSRKPDSSATSLPSLQAALWISPHDLAFPSRPGCASSRCGLPEPASRSSYPTGARAPGSRTQPPRPAVASVPPGRFSGRQTPTAPRRPVRPAEARLFRRRTAPGQDRSSSAALPRSQPAPPPAPG